MTEGGNEAAGDAASSGTSEPVAPESPALAPFRRRAFRWLWLGVLISWTGTWMQTVGAQWLLVDAPNAAALVSLVQAATTLPVMLLRSPAESSPTPSTGAAAVHRSGLLLHRRHPARCAHRRRADAAALLIALRSFSALARPCSCPPGQPPSPNSFPDQSSGRRPGSIWWASTSLAPLDRPRWVHHRSPRRCLVVFALNAASVIVLAIACSLGVVRTPRWRAENDSYRPSAPELATCGTNP